MSGKLEVQEPPSPSQADERHGLTVRVVFRVKLLEKVSSTYEIPYYLRADAVVSTSNSA